MAGEVEWVAQKIFLWRKPPKQASALSISLCPHPWNPHLCRQRALPVPIPAAAVGLWHAADSAESHSQVGRWYAEPFWTFWCSCIPCIPCIPWTTFMLLATGLCCCRCLRQHRLPSLHSPGSRAPQHTHLSLAPRSFSSHMQGGGLGYNRVWSAGVGRVLAGHGWPPGGTWGPVPAEARAHGCHL